MSTATGGTHRARERLKDLFLHPRRSWVHVLIVLLCVGVGFALVAQVRQTQGDTLSTMREDDLVRLLDELTERNNELAREGTELRRELAELESGSSSRAAAKAAAEAQAQVEGILAGTLPVEGPGVVLRISDPGAEVPAATLVTVLEELRNAGAEAVELSGQRMTASSWITVGDDGVVVSGTLVQPPYVWRAIGDPQTLAVALDIPGGALASIRTAGGTAALEQLERVEITATRTLEEPEHAVPADVP
ncbi:DUF881 domain-containing protein [Georgenia faecalis]|uniref:DUF881 domain-containing protein n=1 Tax=Georgenia faecalis TaxID=2483799 RepID=UPI000FD9130C|nr:DUF881 domain-containing protein [Georgenia faecalis]